MLRRLFLAMSLAGLVAVQSALPEDAPKLDAEFLEGHWTFKLGDLELEETTEFLVDFQPKGKAFVKCSLRSNGKVTATKVKTGKWSLIAADAETKFLIFQSPGFGFADGSNTYLVDASDPQRLIVYATGMVKLPTANQAAVFRKDAGEFTRMHLDRVKTK